MCEVCYKIEKNTAIAYPAEFGRDFDFETLQSGPCWHSGICICKSCGKKYSYDYEFMTYEKILLREASEIDKK